MKQYTNIELLDTPTGANHVITVGYGDAHYSALGHTHTLADVTDASAALAVYATKTELSTAINTINLTLASDYDTSDEIAALYATKSELTAYVKTSALNTTLTAYVTSANLATTLQNYALVASLSNYATVSSVSQLRNYVDSEFAKTTTVSQTYATKSELTGYSVTSHQHTVEPVEAVPNSGVITLARNKTQYVKTITGNTVIGFDATALALGANDTATFELLVKMGTYARQVLFGSTVRWLNGEEPLFNTPNTSYLCAFRTYDGGASWVGSYEGQF